MTSKKKKENVVDYNNRPRKRLAQQYLLSHLPHVSDIVIGLSGPLESYENIYKPLMQKYGFKLVIGVDKQCAEGPIINMDIESAISALHSYYKMSKPIVVDCDFCKTAITEIGKLHNILNLMQKFHNHGAILWTLASRKCPDEKTFSLLNEYIFDGTLKIQEKCYNEMDLIEYYHTQNKFTASKIVSYRDGLCAMKTGYIVW